MIDGETVTAIHVYGLDSYNREHVASMDCWCEPILAMTLDFAKRRPMAVVLHSDEVVIAAEVVEVL